MSAGPFLYKLEYLYDNTTPSDASVFIQMRNNPPIYEAHITKEDYDVLPTTKKNDFLTSLFVIAGVTELSTKAYRVWLMKSPVFSWEEVLNPVLFYMASYFQCVGISALPGSANLDGTGFALTSVMNRRPI